MNFFDPHAFYGKSSVSKYGWHYFLSIFSKNLEFFFLANVVVIVLIGFFYLQIFFQSKLKMQKISTRSSSMAMIFLLKINFTFLTSSDYFFESYDISNSFFVKNFTIKKIIMFSVSGLSVLFIYTHCIASSLFFRKRYFKAQNSCLAIELITLLRLSFFQVSSTFFGYFSILMSLTLLSLTVFLSLRKCCYSNSRYDMFHFRLVISEILILLYLLVKIIINQTFWSGMFTETFVFFLFFMIAQTAITKIYIFAKASKIQASNSSNFDFSTFQFVFNYVSEKVVGSNVDIDPNDFILASISNLIQRSNRDVFLSFDLSKFETFDSFFKKVLIDERISSPVQKISYKFELARYYFEKGLWLQMEMKLQEIQKIRKSFLVQAEVSIMRFEMFEQIKIQSEISQNFPNISKITSIEETVNQAEDNIIEFLENYFEILTQCKNSEGLFEKIRENLSKGKNLMSKISSVNLNDIQTIRLTMAFLTFQSYFSKGKRHIENLIVHLRKLQGEFEAKKKLGIKKVHVNIFEPGTTMLLTIDTLLDTEGTIFNASNAIEGLIGYTAEDLRGKSLRLLIPNCIGEPHSLVMKNFISKGAQNNPHGNLQIIVTKGKDLAMFKLWVELCVTIDGNLVFNCLFRLSRARQSFAIVNENGIICELSNKLKAILKPVDIDSRQIPIYAIFPPAFQFVTNSLNTFRETIEFSDEDFLNEECFPSKRDPNLFVFYSQEMLFPDDPAIFSPPERRISENRQSILVGKEIIQKVKNSSLQIQAIVSAMKRTMQDNFTFYIFMFDDEAFQMKDIKGEESSLFLGSQFKNLAKLSIDAKRRSQFSPYKARAKASFSKRSHFGSLVKGLSDSQKSYLTPRRTSSAVDKEASQSSEDEGSTLNTHLSSSKLEFQLLRKIQHEIESKNNCFSRCLNSSLFIFLVPLFLILANIVRFSARVIVF